MDFAVVYLANRALYRIGDFFHHWYVDASRHWLHYCLSVFEKMDRTFAVKVTFQHFFEPLYRDYTAVGRILGVIFRTARIIIGFVIYFFAALIFLVLYLAWLGLPALVIFYAAKNI